MGPVCNIKQSPMGGFWLTPAGELRKCNRVIQIVGEGRQDKSTRESTSGHQSVVGQGPPLLELNSQALVCSHVPLTWGRTVYHGRGAGAGAGSELYQDERGCECSSTSYVTMGPGCPTQPELVTKATVEPSTELASILFFIYRICLPQN